MSFSYISENIYLTFLVSLFYSVHLFQNSNIQIFEYYWNNIYYVINNHELCSNIHCKETKEFGNQ